MTKQVPAPHTWLGVGAVSLGIGAASLAGAGAAQADDAGKDSATPSSSADGDDGASTDQTSSAAHTVTKDGGTPRSSAESSARSAADGPTTTVGDGRSAVAEKAPKTTPKRPPRKKQQPTTESTPPTGDTDTDSLDRTPALDDDRDDAPTATTAQSPPVPQKHTQRVSLAQRTIDVIAPTPAAAPTSAPTLAAAAKTLDVLATPTPITAQSVQPRAVPKAVTPDDPVQAAIKHFVRTFFNQTPTVSFTPGKTTTLQNGTIKGVIRGADADGDVLTYTAGPTNNGGTVAISTDGTFVYTPGAKFASTGTDRFLVTASDEAAANGWHIHGLLGLLVHGWGSAATTTVTVARTPTAPAGPTTPTTPRPPAGPPPGGSSSAAAVYGWGQPDPGLSDEFDGSGAPSASAWGLYRSVGHAGNGLRMPEQITVQDGHLQIAGLSNGTSGGMMGSAVNPAFGRWEARMRVDKQGPGNPYHAVVALIPYGIPYNGGAGDLDFAEADVDEGLAYVFIHHPTNKQSYASVPVDLASWHTYSVEVTPDHVSWFVDGKVTMTTTNRAAITGTRWTANVQLDANSPSGLAPSNMQVDYFRYYPIPPSGAPIIPAPNPGIGNYP
jgi:hypothetical protein